MFGISAAEFLTIVVVAILVAGPQQLPQILRTAGKAYRKLNRFIRKTSQLIDDTLYDADRIADKLTDKKDD